MNSLQGKEGLAPAPSLQRAGKVRSGAGPDGGPPPACQRNERAPRRDLLPRTEGLLI